MSEQTLLDLCHLPESLVAAWGASRLRVRGASSHCQDIGRAHFRRARPMWSFYQIVAGACELQEASGMLAVSTGQGVLVPPGVAHQQRWTPGGDGFQQYILDFELQSPPGHPDPLAGLVRRGPAPLVEAAAPERLIAEVRLALDDAGHLEARRLRVRGLVEAAVLDHLASGFGSGAYELGPPTPTWLRDLLRDLAKLMLDPACDLAMIARRAGRSPSFVQRSFRRHLHTTPLRWLNDQRIDLAARLLLVEPDHAIADLAPTCGFTDPVTFGRNFRRRLGESPRSFRTRQHGKALGAGLAATAQA